MLQAGKIGLQAGPVFAKSLTSSSAGAFAATQVLHPHAPVFISGITAHQHARVNAPTAAAVAGAPSAPSVAPPDSESSSSIATTPRGPSSRDFPCHIKLVIQHAALAQLLSNKGKRMKEIESQHGVVIQTSRYGKASLNPRERLVTIASKDYAGCTAALQSILEVIYSNDSEGAEEQTTSTIVVRLVIPSSCAGIILGPGGDQIARINDAVGASVIIESKMPNAAFIPYRIVNVSGAEIGPCMDAITYVLDLLEKDVKYAEIIKEINSVAFQIVPFPASRAGAVLGPGGAHIKSLQDILKVKIGITSNASNDVGRNSIKHAAVWGMADNVRVACDVLTVATGGTLAESGSRSSLYPTRRIENSSPEDVENSSV